MKGVYHKLVRYSNEDYYPMHMPGHKRNTKFFKMENPYSIDITEIPGFDNLHQAEGILKELSERISRLYMAGQSFPLINGSTAGILAGISAAVNKGDTVLIARNSHKSVYHAITLLELKPVYIYPERLRDLPINCGILPSNIEELLIKHPQIKLVVITSPTYEGVVSDIKEIADIVHRHGALLMVDEAHGAHFGFHHDFPKSAVIQGADIIIQSLHKTLPAFTQTAVLHLNKLDLAKKISRYLSIYQSSSPSYLLMSSIDQCIGCLEEDADKLFQAYSEKLSNLYTELTNLSVLKLVNREITGQNGVYDFDPSKLTISVRHADITGHQLNEMLREDYHIIMEMEASDYVLGMTSICDTKEGFDRLLNALLSIDKRIGLRKDQISLVDTVFDRTIMTVTPAKALQQKCCSIPLAESKGRISAVFISLFPPGSPVLVPGEVIEDELITYLKQAYEEGLTITGLCGDNMDHIEVTYE